MRGYKTLALNLLALVFVWLGIEPETLRTWAGEIVAFLAVANALLRFFTDGPVAGGALDFWIEAVKNWIDRGTFVKTLAVFALLPLLGGCPASIEGAGIGKLNVDCRAFGAVKEAGPQPCLEYISGREIGEAKGTIVVLGPDGKPIKTLTFSIKGVKAFEGQAAAAAAVEDMTEHVSGAVERALPDIVGRLVKGPLP